MSGNIMSQNLYIAGAWGNESKGHTDRRGFTRAVRAQEAEDFTALDLQVKVVNGKSFSIVFRKISCAQDYLARRRPGRVHARRSHYLISHTHLFLSS